MLLIVNMSPCCKDACSSLLCACLESMVKCKRACLVHIPIGRKRGREYYICSSRLGWYTKISSHRRLELVKAPHDKMSNTSHIPAIEALWCCIVQGPLANSAAYLSRTPCRAGRTKNHVPLVCNSILFTLLKQALGTRVNAAALSRAKLDAVPIPAQKCHMELRGNLWAPQAQSSVHTVREQPKYSGAERAPLFQPPVSNRYMWAGWA